MGNRLHRSAVPSYRGSGNNWASPRIAVGKNQPLKRGARRWCSSQPISALQLRQKREEFWDTAPAFEGRQEIWDALRSAAEAAERGDHEMAQAIVDSANIILPTGTLAESYDELGNRYQLPVFVLSKPTNLELDPGGEGTPTDPFPDPIPTTSTAGGGGGDAPADSEDTEADDEDDDDEGVTVVSLLCPHAPPESSCPDAAAAAIAGTHTSSTQRSFQATIRRLFHPSQRRQPHTLSKKSHRRRFIRGASSKSTTSSGGNCASLSSNEAYYLRIRLSTGDDYLLMVTSSQSVLEAKRKLAGMIGWPPDRQRWFCGGLALRDGLKISDCPAFISPPLSFVVQVVVHSPLEPESTWGEKRSRTKK